MKWILVVLVGFVIGAGLVWGIGGKKTVENIVHPYKPVVIGFLPYWNISDKDYSQYVDSIAYFSVTVMGDGTLQKETNPGESEPGWYALSSGKFDEIKEAHSLVVFAGDQEEISKLMEKPEEHAKKLIREVVPLIKKHSFNELNIDIESVSYATPSAQKSFTQFMKTAHDELSRQSPTTRMSIDVSPTALILPYLIDVKSIAPYVDSVIFMTYDFHYPGSSSTGPVSPVNGVESVEEYDVETSIQQALRILPKEKIFLGVPLYGYQWETLGTAPRSATIPGTGITASNKRVMELLSSCATCSAMFDEVGKEAYVIYPDNETGTNVHIFYPDVRTLEERIQLMKKYRLGGMALWALGYEGDDLLSPLKDL